jgi:CHAT domain-containing protein
MPLLPVVLLVGTSGRDRKVDTQDEFRAVQAALDSPAGLDRPTSHVLGAARAANLTPALYTHRPTVVHVAGHGEQGRTCSSRPSMSSVEPLLVPGRSKSARTSPARLAGVPRE